MIDLPPGHFAAPFLAEADRAPDRLALATMDRQVTYGELLQTSLSFAQHMRAAGVTADSRVALVGGLPILMTAATLACALIGCTWLRATHEAKALPALGVTHLLQAGETLSWPGATPLVLGPHWLTPPPPPPGGPIAFTGPRSPDDPWMIAHSSGTTGNPKFMAISAGDVGARIAQGGYAANRAERISTALFPPLAYPSVLPCLRSLTAGGTFLFGNPAALATRFRIDSIMGSPGHFAGLLDSRPPGLPRMPEAIVGGADAGPAFFARMLDHFETVEFLYGSTEAGMTAVRAVTIDSPVGDTTRVGPVAAHCQVRITDPDGAPVPPATDGEVSIRADGMVTRYSDDPTLTAEIFRDGWFYPGDLGRLDAEGQLYITGRVKDLLNIAGTKLNPATVEAALLAVPGIRDLACFADRTGDGIAVLALTAEAEPGSDPAALAAGIAEAARTRLIPALAPHRLYLVHRIPRNENGKVIRAQLISAAAGLPPIPVRAAPPA